MQAPMVHLLLMAVWFAAAPVLFGQVPTPEKRLEDLRQIMQNLPQIHPNLFANVSREEFEAAATRLESDNPRLTGVEFYTRVSALLALTGDAHTKLAVWSNSGYRIGFNSLPVTLRCFSDGTYVIAAPTDHPEWLGARVLSVNGVSIADAISRLEPLISHENDFYMRYRMPTYLVNDGFLRGVGIIEPNQQARLGLALTTGENVDVELIPDNSATLTSALGISPGHAPSHGRDPGLYYWSEYRAESRTLYIRYRTCLEQDGRPIATFIADNLELLDRNPIDTLLFDLRENGGGSSNLFDPLIAGVSERLPRLRENPDFRAYTIADGGTFSSAMMTTEFLRVTDPYAAEWQLGQVGLASLLVGEPTGNRPKHFGQPAKTSLKGSYMNVYCSSKALRAAPWIPDLDAIYPDVLWRQHSTDYFTRHDPWLALVMNRVTRLPAPPEGDVIVVNAASLRPEQGLAPGSFASASGDFPQGPLEVLVEGRRAEVSAATRTQVRFRVPADIKPGMVSIEVRDAQGVARQGRFEVCTVAPALFVSNNADPAQPGQVLNEDNRLNGREAPARRGSVIQILGTGHASNANPVVWIAERKASVVSSGITAEGQWQINAKVPEDVPAGAVPVYVAAGGQVSNAVTIVVE